MDGAHYDIFSGYNAGAAQGKGEILAFVHDDVQFLGNRLTLERSLNLFHSLDTGFLGVAGSRVLLEHACWWQSNPHIHGRGMVCHPAVKRDFSGVINLGVRNARSLNGFC